MPELRSSAEHRPFFCLFDVNTLQLGCDLKVEVVVVTLSFFFFSDLVVVTRGRPGRSFVDYCSFLSFYDN